MNEKIIYNIACHNQPEYRRKRLFKDKTDNLERKLYGKCKKLEQGPDNGKQYDYYK